MDAHSEGHGEQPEAAADAVPAPPVAPPVPRWRRALEPLALALIALVPQLLSQPGVVDADTKSFLYLDPARFLAESLSVWDPTTGLGTVTFQQVGYLWPMGPFFLVTHVLGIPTWAAERLWVAAILFAAGAGMRHLCRTLSLGGPGRMVAALAFMLSPYPLQYLGRISVILLPWAGLPWMVALVARAVRREGGWREPAIFGAVVATVGGINATSLLYVGIAPVLYLAYAAGISRETTWRRAWSVAWKVGLTSLVGSLWWIAGLWADAAYGVNVLKYTETVVATSSTSSPAEVLRGLGYWYFYGTDAYGPWVSTAVQFTQELWLVAASYAVPALAVAFAMVVRWRHRAYFALLVLVGTVLAVGAYPYTDPTAVGGVLKAFYTSTTAGLALRSTDRATPMVLLGLTALLGAGVSALADWLPRTPMPVPDRLAAALGLTSRRRRPLPGPTGAGPGPRRRRRRGPVTVPVPLAAGVCTVLVLALVAAANPAIWNGTTVADDYRMPATVPAPEREAAAALDAEAPGTRVLAEPGEDFAQYDWGDTVDPVWSALLGSTRPFVTREQLLLGSLPSADVLYALDGPVQDDVVDPAGLAPLLRLMSVGDLVVQNDLGYTRYSTPQPSTLWSEFDPTPPGLGSPTGYGPPTPDVSLQPEVNEATLATSPDAPVPSPVEVFPVDDPRPVDRAESTAEPVVVDGDASGIAEAADAGLLSGSPAIVYAGTLDTDPSLERSALGSHPTIVVTDTDKKRAFRWDSIEQDAGVTLTAGEPEQQPNDPNDSPLDLFPTAPADAQTVAVDNGVRSVTASSYGDDVTYLPEDQAANAIDGNPDTAWETGGFFPPEGQWWQVALDRPVTTNAIEVVQPTRTSGSDRYITEVTLHFTDGHHTTSVVEHLGDGGATDATQVLHFPTRTFTTLRITIDATNLGNARTDLGSGVVGFSTVVVGDVIDHQSLEMPSDLLKAAGTGSLDDRLVLTMSRERVAPVPPRSDPETTITRTFTLPTARTFSLSGTATMSTLIPDDEIDDLVGRNGAVDGITAYSSGRLPGDLNDGAQAAIDGNPDTYWSPGFGAGAQVGAWIHVDLPRPVTFATMDLQIVADGMHSVPTAITVSALSASGATLASRHVTLPTIADGRRQGDTVSVPVSFPALTASHIKVTIDSVRDEHTRDYYSGQPIALPVGIAELGIPGVQASATPAQLPGTCTDGLLSIDGTPYPVRIVGSTAAALGNQLVTVEPCGADDVHGITLGAGTHTLTTAVGHSPSTGWDIDSLDLDSAAGGGPEPEPSATTVTAAPTAPAPTVTVLSQSATGARLRITGVTDATTPFWLVMGQSIDDGWHASVAGGGSLGKPTLVDGFANGWVVDPAQLTGAVHHGTLTVDLAFTAQRELALGLVLSLIGFVACVAVAVVPEERWRRARWRPLRRLAPRPDDRGAAGPGAGGRSRSARGAGGPPAGGGGGARTGLLERELTWVRAAPAGPPRPVAAWTVAGGVGRTRMPLHRVPLLVLAALLAATAVSELRVGLVVAVVVALAALVPRARAVVGLVSVGVVVALVVTVVGHQATHPVASGGSWVLNLGSAGTLAWTAVLLVAADAAVEVTLRWRRRPSGRGPVSDDGAGLRRPGRRGYRRPSPPR